jgi:hypothetical protein
MAPHGIRLCARRHVPAGGRDEADPAGRLVCDRPPVGRPRRRGPTTCQQPLVRPIEGDRVDPALFGRLQLRRISNPGPARRPGGPDGIRAGWNGCVARPSQPEHVDVSSGRNPAWIWNRPAAIGKAGAVCGPGKLGGRLRGAAGGESPTCQAEGFPPAGAKPRRLTVPEALKSKSPPASVSDRVALRNETPSTVSWIVPAGSGRHSWPAQFPTVTTTVAEVERVRISAS